MRKKFRKILAFIAAFALASTPAFATDRVLVYPLQNPTSTQQSLIQRYPRVALGNLVRDMLGSSNSGGVYTNMTISPVGGLFVDVAPTTPNNDGTIYQLGVSDANPVPVNVTPQLAADPTVIMLQGMLPSASSSIGPIAVPVTTGQSQYTLIEAQVRTVDATPQQLLLVNQAGGKYYQTANTLRTDSIVFQAKAGTAGTSPTAPTVDAGWVSLGTILVPYGTTTLTTGMITAATPFPGFTSASGTITAVNATAPLTSSGGTTPTLALTTPLVAAYGGTGLTTLTANSVLLGNGTSAVQFVAPGTSGNVLISNGTTWTSAPGGAAGVSSFSAGSTGLTPSSSSTGAITLAGTLGTANGGTGLSSFTSGRALYSSSSSVLTSGLLPTTGGGTGLGSFTSGGALYATSTSTLTTGTLPVASGGTGAVTLTGYLVGNGTSAVTASSTIPTSALTGSIGTANGGTGLTSFTSGGALYATSTSALTSGILPVASGGTGVATASGANSLTLRDASANVSANNFIASVASTVSAGGTTTLTAASSGRQVLTGTSAQTYTLPNATTLSNGTTYGFVNQSTGALTINNNGGTGLYTIPAGGDEIAILTNNGTTNGAWELHGFSPAGATWGTNGINLGTTAGLQGAGVVTYGSITPGFGGTIGTAVIYSGNGTPAFSAPAGSIYMSYSGTGGGLAYYNSSTAGTSGTTWTAIGTGGGGSGGAVYPAPSASPFVAGCQYNSTPPTLTSGSTGAVQCDAIGREAINAVVTVASPLPVTAASVSRSSTNGSITTGGTAQTWAAAGAIVHGCMIQNTSVLPEYLRMDGTAASAASLMLASGGSYECPITGLPTAASSIFGSTTGQTFYSEVW